MMLIMSILSTVQAAQAPTATAFPATWAGTWTAPCTAHAAGKPAEMFAMQLTVAATADPQRWSWRLVYGTGVQQQVRDYLLVVVDPAAGHYVIDEQNGIRIDATLIDDALHAQFMVDDALITVSYRMTEHGLAFDLLSSQVSSARSGGDQGVPEVQSHRVRAAQRALLVRRPANSGE